MSEFNVVDALASQPVWVQVFVALLLLFVVLPLVLYALAVGWDALMSELSPSSAAAKPNPNQSPAEDPNEPSNDLLFQALCTIHPDKNKEEIRDFMKSKRSAEKRAMKRNPKVARVIDELQERERRRNEESTL